MSKKLFEIMYEKMAFDENNQEVYVTKKQANSLGKRFSKDIFENGNVDVMYYGAKIARFYETIKASYDEFRHYIKDIEPCEMYGVKYTPVNGGDTINFEEDEIYNEIKKELKEREALLRLAQKQEVYDAGGHVVTKVSTTPRKSSVTVKF